jgi:bacterioferritin-associated ferredoxin
VSEEEDKENMRGVYTYSRASDTPYFLCLPGPGVTDSQIHNPRQDAVATASRLRDVSGLGSATYACVTLSKKLRQRSGQLRSRNSQKTGRRREIEVRG